MIALAPPRLSSERPRALGRLTAGVVLALGILLVFSPVLSAGGVHGDHAGAGRYGDQHREGTRARARVRERERARARTRDREIRQQSARRVAVTPSHVITVDHVGRVVGIYRR